MTRFLIALCKFIAGAMLLVLLALIIFSPMWAARTEDVKVPTFTPLPTWAPTAAPTAAPTPEGAQAAVIFTPEPSATPEPTATPSPTPTPEPTPTVYTISAVGDCTLSSYPKIRSWDTAFENVVGDNWAYPFTNTAELFKADELSIVNLECSFSDQKAYSGSTFSFLAPRAAANILTLGGIEAATMANNHAMDFGQAIYDDTASTLEEYGLLHCGDGESVLTTTPNGLTVGIYAVYNGHWPDAAKVAEGVKALKAQGAEVVVVCAHWGNEASYYANANQTQVAHAAIDAGASVIFGHGPHRLEPYEEYNGGVIFYSLANFVFGGNTIPQDMDSVIAQVDFTRALDGTLTLTAARAIPCSISSRTDVNDYCPTLFEPGTDAYDRALSKVDGRWSGANNVIDYSFMHPETDG